MGAMHFDTSANLDAIATFCRRAKEIATIAVWRRRWEIFQKQLTKNPLLREYIEQHFPIECAMYEFDRYHRITGRIPRTNIVEDSGLFGLYKFCSILSRVYDRLPPTAKSRLSGRLRGALLGDEGISSIAFELSTCVHLMLRGFDVTWNDLEGNGGFDFLAVKNNIEFEVECKTFSADVGRKIHLRRQYQLGGLIHGALWDTLAIQSPLFVDIVLPDRLSGGDIEPISRAVIKALRLNIDSLGPSPCTVTLRSFEIEDSPLKDFAKSGQFVRDDVEKFIGQRFNCVCRHFTIMGNKGKLAVVAIRSLAEDDVIKGIYRSLKSGSNQFSGDRPAMLCAQLQDVSGVQLGDLAKVRGNGLEVVATNLFKNTDRNYLHSVIFSAAGDAPQVRSATQGNVMKWDYIDQYAGYVFRNECNARIEDPDLLVFGVGEN